MKCSKKDFTMPIRDIANCMLSIGVSENCIVKSFAQYSASTLQNITKYFFNSRIKVNDSIFVTTLKKHEIKMSEEALKEKIITENRRVPFKRIF